MVTSDLARGHTIFASFQNRALVARASGSDSTPLRMVAAVARRSLFQSVVRLTFDALPVSTPFVRFRAPCRDNPSFILAPVRVNNGYFEPIDNADRVHANLAVIEAIVNLFKGDYQSTTSET